MVLIVTAVGLALLQMQDLCIKHDLISIIGLHRLVKKLPLTYTSHISEKKVYPNDIEGSRVLPSTSYSYTQYVETRMSRHPLYTIFEYERVEVSPPSTLPIETRYERVFKYDTNNGQVVITLYTQSNGVDGGSVCIHNVVSKGVEKVVSSLIETMNGMVDPHLNTIVSKMREIIPITTHFPIYRLLEWRDVSYTLFTTSTLVSMPQGEMVFYILSSEGTFLYDGVYITPINTKPSSLTIMSGIWDGSFHPLDIHVSDTTILSGYTYDERRSMIQKYVKVTDDILTPTSKDDIFSFFSTHDRVYIMGERRYEWNDRIHIRVYVGEGGIPFGIDGTFEKVEGTKDIPSHVGDVVDVADDVVTVSPYLLPMSIDKIMTLLYYMRNRVTRDDITGKNCSLYTRYLERMMRYVYMFYRERGVEEVLDISSQIYPSYWRVEGMTTYAIVPERRRDDFISTSRGYVDGDIFLGREGETVVFDEPEIPSVQAVDIVLTLPKDIESYVLMATEYVTTMLTETDHKKVEPLLSKLGLTKESSIPLYTDISLTPRDPSCVERIILTMWRWEGATHEVVRNIYTPIRPGSRDGMETPYGHIVRIGTLGISQYGDTSITHAILEATSPKYRRMDTISKTLYATRHKYPSLKGYPLYMIPPTSWSIYTLTKEGNIYKYEPKTERAPGIVIMDDNGHWETLARPNINGTLTYIW